jgi:superfamily II DNA or RNA helicase
MVAVPSVLLRAGARGTPAQEGAGVKLRPYQFRSRDLVRDAYQSGKRAVALVLPCGAGKTITSTSMMVDASVRGVRSIFLTDRRELLSQTVATLAANGVSAVRVIGADGIEDELRSYLTERGLPDVVADDSLITVASIPTLAGRATEPTYRRPTS